MVPGVQEQFKTKIQPSIPCSVEGPVICKALGLLCPVEQGMARSLASAIVGKQEGKIAIMKTDRGAEGPCLRLPACHMMLSG